MISGAPDAADAAPRPDADCLFCKIIAGTVPAEVILATEQSLAFRDLNPQAPTHVLVIPRQHVPDVGSLVAADPAAAVDLLTAVAAVAAQEGVEHGYRGVFNTGAAAQQTVFHAHVHVIGGRSMTWPPG